MTSVELLTVPSLESATAYQYRLCKVLQERQSATTLQGQPDGTLLCAAYDDLSTHFLFSRINFFDRRVSVIAKPAFGGNGYQLVATTAVNRPIPEAVIELLRGVAFEHELTAQESAALHAMRTPVATNGDAAKAVVTGRGKGKIATCTTRMVHFMHKIKDERFRLRFALSAHSAGMAISVQAGKNANKSVQVELPGHYQFFINPCNIQQYTLDKNLAPPYIPEALWNMFDQVDVETSLTQAEKIAYDALLPKITVSKQQTAAGARSQTAAKKELGVNGGGVAKATKRAPRVVKTSKAPTKPSPTKQDAAKAAALAMLDAAAQAHKTGFGDGVTRRTRSLTRTLSENGQLSASHTSELPAAAAAMFNTDLSALPRLDDSIQRRPSGDSVTGGLPMLSDPCSRLVSDFIYDGPNKLQSDFPAANEQWSEWQQRIGTA